MSNEPRGIRNNNALNIEWRSGTQWQGLDDPPSDGRFARFVEPQWGVRAAVIVMRAYQKRGLCTVRERISSWAPSSENHTENYIGYVCRKTGFQPETRIDANNKDETLRLLKAMALMECGEPPPGTANGNWLDDAVWEAGWSLAKPMTQSKTIGGAAGAAAATVAGAVVEVAQSQMDVIIGAGSAWPKYAAIISTLVALCCIGVVIYSRLQARNEGIR